MIILGVDPGKITGLAFWTSPGEPPLSITFQTPWLLTEVPAQEVTKTIKMILRSRKPELIACERYVAGTGRRAMTHQPDAPELMGELRELARSYDCHFTQQLPGPAKKMAPADVLKRIGAYLKTPDGHANDAARQVVRGLALNYRSYFAELLGV